MPTRSAQDRINNYISGVSPERTREDLIAKKPDMVAQEHAVFDQQWNIENEVKAVLASEDAVTSIRVPMYMAFANELAREKAHFSGGAQLNNEAAVLLAKWKARGLNQAVLIRIRNEVFSIPAPGAP